MIQDACQDDGDEENCEGVHRIINPASHDGRIIFQKSLTESRAVLRQPDYIHSLEEGCAETVLQALGDLVLDRRAGRDGIYAINGG